MFWHNLDQARQRLAGAVVLYDGKPVRFGNIDGRECDVRDIETGKMKTISLEDPAFDDFRRLPPMGFVNVPNSLFLLRRAPIRSQSHGLIRSNVTVFYPNSRGSFTREGVNYDYLVEKYGQHYALRCQKGHPVFADAVKFLKEDQPVAFADKYALISIKGQAILFREEERIGAVEDGTVFLKKPYLCYREDLQDAGVESILEE